MLNEKEVIISNQLEDGLLQMMQLFRRMWKRSDIGLWLQKGGEGMGDEENIDWALRSSNSF